MFGNILDLVARSILSHFVVYTEFSAVSFFFKSVVPIAAAFLLYLIFRSACTKGRQVNYFWLWILCGLPFGIHRMFFWISPGGSMANFVSQGLAMIVLGGIIGGFVLAWRLATAVVYIPLTCFRLIFRT